MRPGTIQQRLDSIGGLLLSQPFFVAGIITSTPRFVNLATTISDFNEVMSEIEKTFSHHVIPEAVCYKLEGLADVKEEIASLAVATANKT